MVAYYNEIDKYAAQWLRNLIAAGHIAPGDVDERSIEEVTADDLRGYTQCHFFAGIAGWSYALRLAGWPDDREVWTGSCPCQPFSVAGSQGGAADKRHLWPAFFRHISQRRPATVFGEQVASTGGRDWLCAVRLDLETLAYAVGAADLCAAGVGAPHIRQRLWWVADSNCIERGSGHTKPNAGADGRDNTGRCGEVGGVEHANHQGPQVRPKPENGRRDIRQQRETAATPGAWLCVEYVPCGDRRQRPTQPGLCPLAHGIPGRVGQLRAYGNAIVPQVATEFILAYMEATDG